VHCNAAQGVEFGWRLDFHCGDKRGFVACSCFLAFLLSSLPVVTSSSLARLRKAEGEWEQGRRRREPWPERSPPPSGSGWAWVDLMHLSQLLCTVPPYVVFRARNPFQQGRGNAANAPASRGGPCMSWKGRTGQQWQKEHSPELLRAYFVHTTTTVAAN
jgi:hypothetical protein